MVKISVKRRETKWFANDRRTFSKVIYVANFNKPIVSATDHIIVEDNDDFVDPNNNKNIDFKSSNDPPHLVS